MNSHRRGPSVLTQVVVVDSLVIAFIVDGRCSRNDASFGDRVANFVEEAVKLTNCFY